MEIFGTKRLREELDGQIAALKAEVYGEPTNKILNVNEAEWIEYLIDKYQIEPLQFDWDEQTVSACEDQIPAEWFPSTFRVHPGKFYAKQVITYHIPYSGHSALLRMKPSSSLLWSNPVSVSNGSVSFKIVNWNNDARSITRESDGIIKNIKIQRDNSANEVAAFNLKVENLAEEFTKSRKTDLLDQSNFLESLGVPVRKSANTPSTFSIPSVKRKVVVKPRSSDKAYSPEPVLSEELYLEILRICQETGVEMERHPSIYSEKDEETLRDHFLMVLSPNFESVTGETFNRKGKTDILVRHEAKNAFVGECKFWSGAKNFEATIDQALGYLTWRDSKAAIILFIRNKNLQPVLEKICPAAESHPCYVSTKAMGGEGWYNFNFHLLEDSTRGVSLGVLAFHLPEL